MCDDCGSAVAAPESSLKTPCTPFKKTAKRYAALMDNDALSCGGALNYIVNTKEVVNLVTSPWSSLSLCCLYRQYFPHFCFLPLHISPCGLVGQINTQP